MKSISCLLSILSLQWFCSLPNNIGGSGVVVGQYTTYDGVLDLEFKEVHDTGADLYHLYQPFPCQDQPDREKNPHCLPDAKKLVEGQLMASPELWIDRYTRIHCELDTRPFLVPPNRDLECYARAVYAYSEFLITYLTGIAFGENEYSIVAENFVPYKDMEIHSLDSPGRRDARASGLDWPYLGKTMIGILRLRQTLNLLLTAFTNNIPGGFMETGVWRGGASIFIRAIFRAVRQYQRPVIVCDSFKGLPPINASSYHDWVNFEYVFYLRVSDDEVRQHFIEAGVYDPQIYFVKGFFNETMPVLSNMVHRLVFLRLDGDMYESTVDVLYRFYDKVSIGGYVYIDDWKLPAEWATAHFFQVHNMTEQLITMDGNTVYWQKTQEVEVQFWRYEQKRFTLDPPPKSQSAVSEVVEPVLSD